jgi:hypothetical protein
MAVCNGGHHLCLEAQTTDIMAKCLVPIPFTFKVLDSNFSPQARFPDKVFLTLLIHCLQVNPGIIQHRLIPTFYSNAVLQKTEK